MRYATSAGLLGALLCGALTSCGVPTEPMKMAAPVPAAASYSVTAPGPFRGGTASADLLVHAPRSIPERLRARASRVSGVDETATLSVGQLSLGGRTLRLAAGQPATLRRFTPRAVATADDVWARVAGGEVAVAPGLREIVDTTDGYLVLGQHAAAPRVHVGAFASLPPLLDVVVNPRWGSALGMPARNAILVSVGAGHSADAVADRLRRVLRSHATVQQLAADLHSAGRQTGYLTGGALAQAVGSFTFVPRENGTVTVDPAWVAANIRTEDVPILGTVTCHRVMLAQLRSALQEVVERGLAGTIDPDQYGGCFHPRYIGHDPAKGLSLHSWGIAVDLNVPGNLRGTPGELDREVVGIFKRWGFAWGGDWSYTDPMHFELAALVR